MTLRPRNQAENSVPRPRAPRLRRFLLGCWVGVAGGCLQADASKDLRAQSPPSVATQGAGAAKDIQQVAASTDDADQKAKAAEKDKESKEPGVLDNMLDSMPLFDLRKPKAPPPPAESVIIRPDGVVPEKPPEKDSVRELLAGAHELYRRGEYSRAQSVFNHIAENTKNPAAVCEEARFYQAECLRLDGHWPKAADVYNDLLTKFPNTGYKEQALQRMFDIANKWLDDTRIEMEETKEKREGKRWIVWPRFVNFDKEKPLLDREGRAIEKLEQVRYHDINGPLADKALFMAGSVKFFNEDYKEAAFLFTQIHERHPRSELAPKAIELAIICKNLSTGGSDYDGRGAAEARKLVQAALENYPELAKNKQDFLLRQIVNITYQQAEKDFKTAEFYKHTGHPGAAYFCYEMVRRRYPNTKFSEMSTAQLADLKDKLEKADGGPDTRSYPTANSSAHDPAPKLETAPLPRLLVPGRDTAPPGP